MSRERDAADRMHSAAIHLLRRVREVDEEAMGISPARASALSVLVFGGPRTLGELAEAERVTAPTMSRLVAAMEAEGLVRREPHATDGRSIRLQATAKGRRILERGRARRLDLFAELLADADERQVRAVRDAAEIIEECLAASSASSRASSSSRARTR
jgi:DNA-binding MarR family transcriptional regulator